MKNKEYIIKEFEDLLYLEKLRVLILTKELLELPVKFEEFRSEVNRRTRGNKRKTTKVGRNSRKTRKKHTRIKRVAVRT